MRLGDVKKCTLGLMVAWTLLVSSFLGFATFDGAYEFASWMHGMRYEQKSPKCIVCETIDQRGDDGRLSTHARPCANEQ